MLTTMKTDKKNERRYKLLALLCLPAFLLSACQTGSGYNNKRPTTQASKAPGSISAANTNSALAPTQSAPQPEIEYPVTKVAILLPLSGQHKDLGQAMLNASQIALFDIGHTNFKLIPRDTGGTAQGATTAAQAAIEDGAQLILGPVFAPAVRAAKPIAARARVNMVSFSTDWSLAGNNTFIMGFLPFDQVRRVTEYAASKNIQRIGLLTPQSSYGQVVERAFSDIAPRHNIEITSRARFTPHSANLAPTIKNFTRYDQRKAAGALNQSPFDAVLMPAGGEDARSIANLLSHNNLPPRNVVRIGTGLMDNAALATESNLENAWFAAPAPQTRQRFESRYFQTFSQKPPRLSTLAYDATALAATLSRQNITHPFNARAIANPNGFAGIDGIFRFRSDNTAERGLAVLSFKRGSIVVLDPPPSTFQQTSALQ